MEFKDMFGNQLRKGDFVLITTMVKTDPFVGIHKILSFTATGIRTIGIDHLPLSSKANHFKRSFKKMIRLDPTSDSTFERFFEELDK